MARKKKSSDSNADNAAGQIPSPSESVQHALGINMTEFLAMHCFGLSINFKHTLYPQFGINRYELWALLSLHGYLTTRGKVIASQGKFIDYLSGSFNTIAKIEGYMHGLHRLKAIGSYEYIRHPGSLSIGITDFGYKIIDAYSAEFNKFHHRFKGSPKMTVVRANLSNPTEIPSTHRAHAA